MKATCRVAAMGLVGVLAAGYHKIRIAFFDADAGGHLGVFWQPPGAKRQLLPAGVLSHTD